MSEDVLKQLSNLREYINEIPESNQDDLLLSGYKYFNKLVSVESLKNHIEKRLREDEYYSTLGPKSWYKKFCVQMLTPTEVSDNWAKDQNNYKDSSPSVGLRKSIAWAEKQMGDYSPEDTEKDSINISVNDACEVFATSPKRVLYKPRSPHTKAIIKVLKSEMGNPLSGDGLAREVEGFLGTGKVIGGVEVGSTVRDINEAFAKKTEVPLIINESNLGYCLNSKDINFSFE